MQETFHSIDGAKLNKNEIDILCNIAESPRSHYSITDIINRSGLHGDIAEAAVHHLILEGLLDWTRIGESVCIPQEAADWLADNRAELIGIANMINCDLFPDSLVGDA